jgi:hypothetical protein
MFERGNGIIGEEFGVLLTFLLIKLYLAFEKTAAYLVLNLNEISYLHTGFIEAFISLQEHNGIV